MNLEIDERLLTAAFTFLEECSITAAELRRPSRFLRPEIKLDGNQWCAMIGENIQEGVVGFGDTPEKASAAFDEDWYTTARVMI